VPEATNLSSSTSSPAPHLGQSRSGKPAGIGNAALGSSRHPEIWSAAAWTTVPRCSGAKAWPVGPPDRTPLALATRPEGDHPPYCAALIGRKRLDPDSSFLPKAEPSEVSKVGLPHGLSSSRTDVKVARSRKGPDTRHVEPALMMICPDPIPAGRGPERSEPVQLPRDKNP
jgi:hypothetical protein